MATERMRRVNEVVREVLAGAIPTLEDPRIGFVTVTAVDTSTDLRSARVHVSVLGDAEERELSLAALGSSRGLLQGAIANELRLKRTPTLTFIYDDGPERMQRLGELLEGER